MKPMPWTHLDQHRIKQGEYASPVGANFGAFFIPGPCAQTLKIIVSNADLAQDYPWDHVSVSCKNRCPNWPEMEFIKRLFFADDECAMQLHVPVKEHKNFHDNCLHIWKPKNIPIPQPPSILVAPCEKHSPAEKDGIIVCEKCGLVIV